MVKTFINTCQPTTQHIDARGTILPGTEHPSQDLWGSSFNTVWVIDGASRANGEENNAAAKWVGTLSSGIRRAVFAHSQSSLNTILAEAIAYARGNYSSWHPSAAVCIARVNDTTAELLVLGDCMILAKHTTDGAVSIFTDTRLNTVAVSKRETFIRSLHSSNSDNTELLHKRLLAAEARACNMPGGYWIARDNPDAASHAVTAELADVSSLVLMTDGASGLLDAGDTGTVFDNMLVQPEQELQRLRSDILTSHDHCDDMTLVAVRL